MQKLFFFKFVYSLLSDALILYCFGQKKKIELVILKQHFSGFFPVCDNH